MLQEDQQKINDITARFFDLFTNTNQRKSNLRDLVDFFLPNGIIINNTAEQAAVYDLEGFILPRETLLNSGKLIDFSEWEIAQQTTIHGNIAHRICSYEKSGQLEGKAFQGKGKKMMQFIKIEEQWFLSSVVWTDKPL